MKEGGILIGKLLSSSASAASAACSSGAGGGGGSAASSLSALLLGVLLERSGLRGLQVKTELKSRCIGVHMYVYGDASSGMGSK